MRDILPKRLVYRNFALIFEIIYPIMKQMKIFFGLLAAMSVLCLSTTSCKKNDDGGSSEETNYYTLTVDAGQPSDDDTPLSAGQSWKAGDRLSTLNTVYKRQIESISYDNATRKFSGELANLYQQSRVALFYPADVLPFRYSDTIAADLSVARQAGTEATLLDYKAGMCDTIIISDKKSNTRVHMKTLLAQGTFHFTHQGQPIDQITKVEIYALEGTMYSSRTFNFKRQDWTSTTNSNLSVVNTEGLNGSMVVSLIPTESVRMGVSLETLGGVRYTGQSDQLLSIDRGQKYEFSFECEKYDKKAKVGDYYFSDGTFDSQLQDNKTAVGIVFALSDKAGGPINFALEESYHGRVVSFKDLTTQQFRWAQSGQHMKDNKKLENIPHVIGNDSLAFLPYPDLKGNDSYYQTPHINVSIDKVTGKINNWPTEGALTSFNGKYNTEVCDSAANIFPAAYYCANLTLEGVSNKDWYLPATGELALLFELWRYGIICSEVYPKFHDFIHAAYWSSDESNKQRAWVINFHTGMVFRNVKNSSYYVRPCMLF